MSAREALRVDPAARVAQRFRSPHFRYYAGPKLRRDPAFSAVARELGSAAGPVLDVGCGIGLLPFFLRECGIAAPIVGIDRDERRVTAAREAAAGDRDMSFILGDVMDLPPIDGNVVILDVLHYLTEVQRASLLNRVADGVPAGGTVIIRDAVRDGSWRYRVTLAQETFSRVIGWLRVPRLSFPQMEEIVKPFRERRFESTVRPMWGRTPFNNYLFVFRRSSDGTVNA
ncbi:MAG TPA: methyltransferase domain-containing protein [Thermoanaerobaculia bacterium]|nr:methyltransferase domain-containing protein [Thermoanaerobaculia bacterium]